MRGSVLAGLAATGLAAVLTASVSVARAQAPARESLAARCERIGNDDTVRGYAPALDGELRAAFARLFPDAQKPADEEELRAEANVRCMGGRLYACFVGANLPCGKMNVERRNPGASAYCGQNPSSAVVPMAATGHDTIYSYRCHGGRAIVNGEIYKLDRRGFAASLWTRLD